MKRSKLLLVGLLISTITSGAWAAVLTDDADTLALWHMDAITSQGSPARNYVLDDDSAAPVNMRNFDLLLGWNAVNAAYEPTVVAGQAGYGNCLSFDGVDDCAFYFNGWNGYSAVTVDFWVNPGANAYRSNDPNTEQLVNGGPWQIVIEPNATSPRFAAQAFSSAGGYPYFPYILKLPAQVGVWQHVIFSVSNNNMTLTVDGTSVTSATFTGTLDKTVAGNIGVGNLFSIFGPTKWGFQGQIDEMKISSPGYAPWKAPLTDELTTKGLWHFDSVNPTTYKFMDDDSAHITRNADLDRYNGTTKLTDTTTVPTAVNPSTFIPPYGETTAVGYPAANSAFGNCVYFDGISDRCQILNTNLPAIDGNSLTIQFWMRPDDSMTKYGDGADHYWQMVDRWYQVMIWFREYGTTGHLVLQALSYAKNGVSNTISYDLDAKGVNYKQWMHIKYTCVGTAVTLYLNGASIGTATLSVAGLQAPNQTNTFIGSRYERSRTFWGFIDEFKIDSVAHCGDAGYNQMDLNKDCVVDMKDLQTVALGWLSANPYSGNSGSANYPALVEQKWADTGNFNIPHAIVTPTIDGTFNGSEWADARTIELIYPTLTTTPNRGSLRSGTTAPGGNADYSLFWYAKWDSTYLYLACVVDDNDINAGLNPANGYSYDAPQINFNYLNNPSNVQTTSPGCYTISFHSGITVPYSNGGPTFANSSMVRNNVFTSGNGGYSVIEARLAWSDLTQTGYVPAVGNVHGCGFFCQDHDMAGTRLHALADYNCNNSGPATVTSWNTMTLVNTIDCHEKLQSIADLDSDCTVNFKDFSKMAANWLSCTDPSGVKCKM